MQKVLRYRSKHVYNKLFAEPNDLLDFKLPKYKPEGVPHPLFGQIMPVLAEDHVRQLFLQYNCAKYLISKLQTALQESQCDADLLEAERLIHIADNACTTLVKHNLQLVLLVVKRRSAMEIDRYELNLSDKCLALLNCINGFDVDRGFKFNTYAIATLTKSSKTRKQVRLDIAWKELDFVAYVNLKTGYHREINHEANDTYGRLSKFFTLLDQREAFVLKSRYGIDNHAVLTLQQLGERYGISRERVRQIEDTAIGIIRRGYVASRQTARSKVLRADTGSNCQGHREDSGKMVANGVF